MRGNHLIREARRRAGLTQAELAQRVGTTQSAIARLERGSGNPTLQRISELVDACGLELQVRLVPKDTSDWSLVERNAALDPEARIRQALGAIRLAEEVAQAGRRDRAKEQAGG
jgi:transcriptional regulator with XRE-family HTH domain